MPITNAQVGTRIDEIAEAVYRISTPVREIPGGFSFNQFLVLDDEPLLFHTGPRRMFPLVREAIAAVLPVEKLRWVAFSHFEADECGALNDLLAVAPHAEPTCSQVGKLVSVDDTAIRPARGRADGETFSIGRKTLEWIDTPQLPHAWECGLLFDQSSQTLFCGDLFTQPGADNPPLTDADILGPSEEFRKVMDYYSYTRHARVLLDKLATRGPRTLACMHGSSWQGDAPTMLRALADVWAA